MNWSEVSNNVDLYPLREVDLYPEGRPLTCLVYTSVAEIPHLEDMIQRLPNVCFKIAARVLVSDELARLLVYPNVTVYSGINNMPNLDAELVTLSDVLLDINPGEKTIEILDRFQLEDKPILAFEEVKSTEHHQQVFPMEDWQGLVDAICNMRKVRE